jgi:plasmid maintenance system antidote protein VapI
MKGKTAKTLLLALNSYIEAVEAVREARFEVLTQLRAWAETNQQRELALTAGISPQHLNDVIHAKRALSPSVAQSLAHVLVQDMATNSRAPKARVTLNSSVAKRSSLL